MTLENTVTTLMQAHTALQKVSAKYQRIAEELKVTEAQFETTKNDQTNAIRTAFEECASRSAELSTDPAMEKSDKEIIKMYAELSPETRSRLGLDALYQQAMSNESIRSEIQKVPLLAVKSAYDVICYIPFSLTHPEQGAKSKLIALIGEAFLDIVDEHPDADISSLQSAGRYAFMRITPSPHKFIAALKKYCEQRTEEFDLAILPEEFFDETSLQPSSYISRSSLQVLLGGASSGYVQGWLQERNVNPARKEGHVLFYDGHEILSLVQKENPQFKIFSYEGLADEFVKQNLLSGWSKNQYQELIDQSKKEGLLKVTSINGEEVCSSITLNNFITTAKARLAIAQMESTVSVQVASEILQSTMSSIKQNVSLGFIQGSNGSLDKDSLLQYVSTREYRNGRWISNDD